MTNPWMIMVVGTMTVFIALFVMILFLLGFPKLFAILKRKEHESLAPLPQIVEVTKRTAPSASQIASAPSSSLQDESLIAVLTAAVAAASGSSAGSFAITNVQQAQPEVGGGFNTPVWGRIERLSRK